MASSNPVPLKPVDPVRQGPPKTAVSSSQGQPPRSVPVTDAGQVLYGKGLLTSEGTGVRQGRPYGEQLVTEANEVNQAHKFFPGAAAKLRAATRKALGR